MRLYQLCYCCFWLMSNILENSNVQLHKIPPPAPRPHPSAAGGSVELGESVEQTAERELFEETGLKAQKLELLGVYSGERMQYTYPNGDKVSNVDIVYTCHEYTGELKMQASEVSQLKFIDICDLPEDIFPPNRPAIEDYINKNKT